MVVISIFAPLRSFWEYLALQHICSEKSQEVPQHFYLQHAEYFLFGLFLIIKSLFFPYFPSILRVILFIAVLFPRFLVFFIVLLPPSVCSFYFLFSFLLPISLFKALPFVSVLVLPLLLFISDHLLAVHPSYISLPFHCFSALWGHTLFAVLRLPPHPSLDPFSLFRLPPDFLHLLFPHLFYSSNLY